MANGVKTSEYGDYRLYKEKNSRNASIVQEARKYRIVGKHAGSKPMGRLMHASDKARAEMKKLKLKQKND